MAGRWVQKTWPFLDDSVLTVKVNGKVLNDWYMWCLAVADATCNVPPFAASAWDAWLVNDSKHEVGGMDIPIGFYVPVFYKGGQYGHVVIAYRESYEKITVWSSPYTHKPYFDVFSGPVVETLDKVGRIYGVNYVGWTEKLGSKQIIQWEAIQEAEIVPPAPKPLPEPTPEPVVDEPAESEPVVENPPEVEKPEPAVIADDCDKVTKEDFEKALERNIKYMEKVNEIITEAGQGITFSAKTKKIVYIVCDLLLLAGAEVTPIMTMINSANDPTTFGSALTQALFIAGFGGLMIFKLLKAKGDKKTETPTTPEA